MSNGAARWKYKTVSVQVDDNTVVVRGLTAGERQTFAETSKRIRDAKAANSPDAANQALNVPRMVAKFGIVAEPPLTDDDLTAMPGDLLDAAVTKILELSGVKPEEKDEKKETAATAVH